MKHIADLHWIKFARLVSWSSIAIAAGAALAQEQGSAVRTWDYYKAAAAPEVAQTLRNVETFHIEPGLQRMKEKNYRSALSDFEFILGYFPNHPRALMLISDLCDVNWKSPLCDAELYFPRAFEINPNASQTYTIYGVHLQRRKELDKAITSYQRALELNPTSSNAHYNLGLAYFDQQRFDSSNQHAQAAYALGFPLPGLKDRLARAGQWKPLPDGDLKRLTTRPETRPAKTN